MTRSWDETAPSNTSGGKMGAIVTFFATGRFLAWSAFLALMGFSFFIHLFAGMEYFADSSGKMLGGLLAVSLFAAEIVLGYRGRQAWNSGKYMQSVIIWIAALGVAGQAFVFELAYLNGQWSMVTASKQKEVRVDKSVDGEIERLETERGLNGEWASASTLKSDLEARKLDRRWADSKSCTESDRFTRTFCLEVQALRGRITKAERTQEINAKIETLRARSWDTKIITVDTNHSAEWAAAVLYRTWPKDLTKNQRAVGDYVLTLSRTGLVLLLMLLSHYLFLAGISPAKETPPKDKSEDGDDGKGGTSGGSALSSEPAPTPFVIPSVAALSAAAPIVAEGAPKLWSPRRFETEAEGQNALIRELVEETEASGEACRVFSIYVQYASRAEACGIVPYNADKFRLQFEAHLRTFGGNTMLVRRHSRGYIVEPRTDEGEEVLRRRALSKGVKAPSFSVITGGAARRADSGAMPRAASA